MAMTRKRLEECKRLALESRRNHDLALAAALDELVAYVETTWADLGECLMCAEPILRRAWNARFCSKYCSNRFWKRQTPRKTPTGVNYVCKRPGCGVVFVALSSRRHGYCSKLCKISAKHSRYVDRHGGKMPYEVWRERQKQIQFLFKTVGVAGNA